jgi:hypothetical protein
MSRLARSRLYFLAKDPHWTFLWWELREEDVQHGRQRLEGSSHSLQFILRIHDVTSGLPAVRIRNQYSDVEVIGPTDHWYLYLAIANRTYCAEAGWLCNRTQFQPIVRSNVLVMPRESPSDVHDEAWSTPAIQCPAWNRIT